MAIKYVMGSDTAEVRAEIKPGNEGHGDLELRLNGVLVLRLGNSTGAIQRVTIDTTKVSLLPLAFKFDVTSSGHLLKIT